MLCPLSEPRGSPIIHQLNTALCGRVYAIYNKVSVCVSIADGIPGDHPAPVRTVIYTVPQQAGAFFRQPVSGLVSTFI